MVTDEKNEKKSFFYWFGVWFWTLLAPVLLVIFLDMIGALNPVYAWWSGIDELPLLYEIRDDFLTGARLYGAEYGPKIEAFYASVSDDITLYSVRKKTKKVWSRELVISELAADLPKKKIGDMQAYLDYIERYKEYAILEMQRTGIPASITLAQGLLESDADRSRLARIAKNHFGIKCRAKKGFRNDGIIDDEDFVPHSICVGCLQANDDHPWDRFEMYDDVLDSYRRHSILLKQSRYNWMIKKYRIGQMCSIPREIFGKDYVPYYAAWAVGLKDSGYATSRSYAEKVILIIEYYRLDLVDREGAQA